ncbi:MAG: CTP synthase [Planctomycetota bacterium]
MPPSPNPADAEFVPTSGNPTTSDASPDPSADAGDLLRQAGSTSHETEFFNPIPAGYVKGKHKFVMVFGTVMSGLGKGIFSSSLAKLLKDKGLRVSPVKMEGYLNLDSGTLNPYRHGEVFVLDDGLETDMDLGTYERLLDQNLSKANYTTSGQIFQGVLDKERQGKYLGRDVQMIPHVTSEVKHMLRSLAVKQQADVVFVEVGGTVGDYENAFYIEALRQLAFEEGPENVCFVALTYIIEPPALGEQKTKAAQLGLKKLLEAGVQPHIVATRGMSPLAESARQKIAMFSNVPMANVFSMHDRKSIYTIPEALRAAGLDRQVLTRLDLHDRVDTVTEDRNRTDWRRFVERVERDRRFKAKIGITGKYAGLRDAYASIDKALEHCAVEFNAELDVEWLDTTEFEPDQAGDRLADFDAVIVPGGFGHRGTESKIACVGHCREQRVPYLGICLGFQMAVVEFARNVCGLDGAGSSEFDSLDLRASHPVIDILPEQKQIEGLGGNMRLGGKDVRITPGTLAAWLFADCGPATRRAYDRGEAFTIRERFRHRYEVDPRFIERLESAGLVFSGRHPQQPIMQVLELPTEGPDGVGHPYFVGGQFHPELTSRPLRPQPMFLGLVAAAIRHAQPDADPAEISPRWLRIPGAVAAG